MTQFRRTLRKILPAPFIKPMGEAWDTAGRFNLWIGTTLHPWYSDSIKRLSSLKNIHAGERCFIIGNGPSLRHTNLTRLGNAHTFGLNRIYMHFPEMGFQTSYYLSVNDLVVQQCAAEIQALKMPKFVSWRAHRWLKPQPDLYFLFSTYTGPRFTGDIRKRLWEGATVTFVALQAAYFLGFQEVILVGVDHSFVSQGKPNATITSEGDDLNHFHPGYFGKGFRWQLPDLETSEKAYRMARQAYEADNRSILDATIGGNLTVFPKIEFESLF
jgi:hypothetical protein